MANKIQHVGTIESIEDMHVRVRIQQTSACASCKISNHCNAAESKEKLIDVYTTTLSGLAVGQEVTVSTTTAEVHRAVLIGFVLPLILLIATLVTSKLLGCHEEVAALLAIGILLPYYICVWLFRSKLSRMITFEIDNNKY